MPEKLPACKSGALTQVGSNYSSMRTTCLRTLLKIKYLMLLELKMKKVNQFRYTRHMANKTKNGMSDISMKPRNKPRDSTVNSVSTSTDHSTSDQECQCKESWNLLVPTMSPLRDGERMFQHNNGGSIKNQRPSIHNNGRTMLWKFNPMVDHKTLDVPQVLHQDGGNCSRCKDNSLPTRKERSQTSQEVLIPKTETSLSTTSTVK